MLKNARYLGVFLVLTMALLIATGCSTTDTKQEVSTATGPEKIELENGTITGNIIVNSQPDNATDGKIEGASGDFLYMTDSGNITVSVNAPQTGDYVIKIYYALPTTYGDKENNVIVNDNDLGPQKFPSTGGEWTAKWIQATLNEGANAISISHNWGYTWFDYLTIEPLF